MDGISADAAGLAHVERLVEADVVLLDRLRERERLENGAELVDVLGHAVMQRRDRGLRRFVASSVGSDDDGEDFAGAHVQHDAAGGIGLEKR